MSGWVSCTVGDQITLQRGVDITKKDARPGNIPVFSSSGLSSYHDTPVDTGPGVIIGRKGSLGTVHWSDGPFWPHDTTLWVKDFKGNDRKFVFYFLTTLDTKGLDVGSSNPTLNRNHVHPIPVSWPPLSEQREIAAILGALDDKIEMNRKTAATLEAMARALYRSWFVDFDPVWAKLEGRAPAHMDPTTAALFPDRFTEDGLPEGWEVVPYSEHIELVSGGTPKTSEPSYWGGDIPWYSVVDAPAPGMVFSHETTKNITERGFQASAVNLVSKGVTIISARGTVGKLAMAGKNMVFNQSCYGLRGRFTDLKAFIYFATEFAVERLQAMAHGAVFSTITRATFDGLQVIKAPPMIHEAFEEMSGSILERVHSLGTENQTLAALRDSLLPRLMSGELRVPEARDAIEGGA